MPRSKRGSTSSTSHRQTGARPQSRRTGGGLFVPSHDALKLLTPAPASLPPALAASAPQLLHNALRATAGPRLRSGPLHCSRSHTFLLVGEGDFSFAQALVQALALAPDSASSSPTTPAIVATSLDPANVVATKYSSSDAPRRLQQLKASTSARIRVLHNVDATAISRDDRVRAALHDVAPKRPLNRVIFNFPHVGGGSDADVAANRRMLYAFFVQTRALMVDLLQNPATATPPPDCKILATLRNTPFYAKFTIELLASAAGFVTESRSPFDGERWAALGYRPQRTNPAVMREAPGWENAELFVFHLRTPDALSPSFEPAVVDGLESDEEDEDEESDVPNEHKRQQTQPRILSRKERRERAKSQKKEKGLNKKLKSAGGKMGWPGKVSKKDSWNSKSLRK
ncbi:hypothetical protein HDU83_001075 [Entophlyctis luteolus]|nr:hypothetical protein HDU82_002565 [Entophlyctis luteolus]KAJ3348733.1 hypothetical protein HDU83_001075 [Entophlyctis luteolus]